MADQTFTKSDARRAYRKAKGDPRRALKKLVKEGADPDEARRLLRRVPV